MKAFRIMSLVETDDAKEVIVSVYCPTYEANRKYLEDKYEWRVFSFEDDTQIEDIFQREINRELLKSIGLDQAVSDFLLIAAQVFGVCSRDNAMLMKLELGTG